MYLILVEESIVAVDVLTIKMSNCGSLAFLDRLLDEPVSIFLVDLKYIFR